MSTTALPPPHASFNSNMATSPNSSLQPRSVPIQTDLSSADKQGSDSSVLRAPDVESAIIEEEDGTSASETLNEPLTPTDPQSPQNVSQKHHAVVNEQLDGSGSLFNSIPSKAANPPASLLHPSPSKRPTDLTGENMSSQPRPTPSKEPGIKRAFSNIFRRSNSHMTGGQGSVWNDQAYLASTGALELATPSRPTQGTVRRISAIQTPVERTPATTRSNTPPSPGNSDGRNRSQTYLHDPSPSVMFSSHKKNRSQTGFGHIKKRIGFSREKGQPHPDGRPHRARSTSMDLQNMPKSHVAQADVADLGSRHPWGMPAAAGTGLKARRLSLSLPDTFLVEVGDLHKEYSDQSKLVGKRGKTLGKGATSKVTLMVRKGGSSELFAVKEFRGKQKTETEDEYEKKVKSEYSISKSLHHPNIVETFSLCVDNGRWNHVMEYCDHGDLFNLVKHGHLKTEARSKDRLCLFKQLVQGVHYLHSNGIAHRDIKLENLLIKGTSTLKITDFGVSEVFTGIHPGLRAAGGQCGKDMGDVRLCEPGICGSLPYIAPEVLKKQGMYI
jgi:protein-serine/threonine kinase